MNKLLTPQYILKTFAITTKINVVAFVAAVLLSVGWTYLLFGFGIGNINAFMSIFMV